MSVNKQLGALGQVLLHPALPDLHTKIGLLGDVNQCLLQLSHSGR